MRAVASRAAVRKRGILHCLRTKVTYPFTPSPWKPEVSMAQKAYTAHSRMTNT